MSIRKNWPLALSVGPAVIIDDEKLDALAAAGIRLYGGVSGNADAAVEAFLAGELAFNPNVKCNHHDHHHGEEHTCGDHGCGSHNCGHH